MANTFKQVKMQCINLCYMGFILQALGTESAFMDTKHIKHICLQNDVLYVTMSDFSIVQASDLDPEISTQAIKEWNDKHPQLHKKVLELMEGNF